MFSSGSPSSPFSSLDSACSLNLSLHLHPSQSLVSFTLYPYLALCLSIYFTRSYLSLAVSITPPALLSFIFHSLVLSSCPSPSCFPIPLMDDVNLCPGPQTEERGFAVESNLKANSTDSHLRVLQHDASDITCGSTGTEQPLQVLLHSHCRTEGKTFSVVIKQINWKMY